MTAARHPTGPVGSGHPGESLSALLDGELDEREAEEVGRHLSGCAPLLILDVFEHAFMLDYGLKRADYIEAFFKSIDWKTVESRFKP